MPADLDPKRFGYLLKGVADPAAADRAAVKRKAFVASDMGRNITGVDLLCDGGIMAMGGWDQRVGLQGP